MKSISSNAKKAILIGSLCSISYLAVYLARNILGAVQPQMLAEGGIFVKEFFGTLSSIFFITYAVGQLINGAIGDKIKPRYMISFGLLLAGVCNLIFPFFGQSEMLLYLSYGATGFFLSMIYGPMTKVVAENTEPIYATRCSLGYTFASFFGSPLAGLIAAYLTWQSVFFTSSAALLGMGAVCFFVFYLFERKGLITYHQFDRPKTGKPADGIKILIKHRIIKFTGISILTGVVRTTVVFWLPTYINEYLNFSADDSARLYTVATLFISTTAFIAVFLYERLGRNMDRTILVVFTSAAICFFLVSRVSNPWFNLVFLVLAIMSSNSAATMLWSRYCPGLRDTGMVSSATGYLDFCSYMAAAASSKIFANAVSVIGWGNLVLVWFGLMICGVLLALPYHKLRRKDAEGRA